MRELNFINSLVSSSACSLLIFCHIVPWPPLFWNFSVFEVEIAHELVFVGVEL
jgi:hypothetical protein